MTTALLSTETCATTTKLGMVTSWTLAGSTTAYAGTLATDGYTLEASLTMVVFSDNVVDNTVNTTTGAVKGVIGTCVETYDSAGTVVAATVVDDGNLALCHWFIVDASATVGLIGNTGTANEYSIANYMTATQWGTAGNAIIGNGLLTRGTRIGTTLNFERTPSTQPTGSYTATAYKQKWYQPTYAATYTSSALRRYNGGTSDGDKVKAYCAEIRTIATTDVTQLSTLALVPATVAGTSGVVQLTGAQALAAGAIAFGVAALAF
jgi:hypothetical protein